MNVAELAKTVAETVKAGVDIAVDSKAAPLAATPPAFITGSTLFGVTWRNWMYIMTALYTFLLVVGWTWNAVRKLRK